MGEKGNVTPLVHEALRDDPMWAEALPFPRNSDTVIAATPEGNPYDVEMDDVEMESTEDEEELELHLSDKFSAESPETMTTMTGESLQQLVNECVEERWAES